MPCSEKACLIVAERGKDAQPPAAQFCLLRDFRQELFRQSRPADGLAVKVRSGRTDRRLAAMEGVRRGAVRPDSRMAR